MLRLRRVLGLLELVRRRREELDELERELVAKRRRVKGRLREPARQAP